MANQPAPAEISPHDRPLECDLVGGLLSHSHCGTKPDPDDFYDPTLARIARAIVDHGDRLFYSELAVLERDEPVYSLVFEGLAEVLAELGDLQPRRTAFFAGILAASAPVTGPGDVAKLERLAAGRRRLIELEYEKHELHEELDR